MPITELIDNINVGLRFAQYDLKIVSDKTNRVELRKPDGAVEQFDLMVDGYAKLKEYSLLGFVGTNVKKALLGDKLVYVALVLIDRMGGGDLVGVRSTYEKIMALCQEHYQSATYDENAQSVKESIVYYDGQSEDVLIFELDNGVRYLVTESILE